MNFKLFESFSELDGEIVERSERRRRPGRVWAGLAVAAACVAVIVAVAVPGLRHGGAVEPEPMPEQMQDPAPAPMPAPMPDPTPDPEPGTAYEPTPGTDPTPAPAPEPDPSPAPEPEPVVPEPAPSPSAPEPDNYWSAEEMCAYYYGVAYFEELPDGVEAAADFSVQFGDGSVGYHISRKLFDEIAGEASEVVLNTDVESEDAMVVVGAPWMDITCMLPPEVTYNECLSALAACPTEEFFDDMSTEPMTATQLGYVWPGDCPAALLGDGDEEYYVNHCNVRGWARYNDGGLYEMALEYRDEETGKAARVTILPAGHIYLGEHPEPEGEVVTSFMGQLEFTAYRYATDAGVRLRAEFEIGLARYFVDVETDADDGDEAEGKLVLETVVSCFQRNALEGVYPDFGAFRQGDGESGGTRVGAPCGGG